MPTRTIEFVPKMQDQFKERVLAVAWVTAQQPGRCYQNRNVVRAMTAELAREGFRVPTTSPSDYPGRPIIGAMKWLEEHGYAIRSMVGKVHTAFLLDSDLDVPPPRFVLVRMARETAAAHPAPAPAPAPAPSPCPPLPDPKPSGLMSELNDRVADWWRSDPEGAERWIKAAVTALAVPDRG